ncbi:MAG: MFS transporter, partial [Alphaproteobacteria bacterium]|nr:MFS transporter [Alphaproteobacteria bacterium]
IDRRYVLLLSGAGLTMTGFLFTSFSADQYYFMILALAIFIGLGESTYTIGLANANDRAEPGEYASIGGAVGFVWCIGSIIGPIVGSMTLSTLGTTGVSAFFVVVSGLFTITTLLRVIKREGSEEAEQIDFTPSPVELAATEIYYDDQEAEAGQHKQN